MHYTLDIACSLIFITIRIPFSYCQNALYFSCSDDEPSLSRAEEQALRVTAEARIERLQHDLTLQSAEINTLQTTLTEKQAQNSELSEETEKLKTELFHVEVQLAESREKLTLSENAVQTLNKECTTLRTSLHVLQEGSGDVLDSQYTEQQKLIAHLRDTLNEQSNKLQHTESVINVQQQLLTQKDVQIQHGKDAQYTQQHLYNALQLQLKESQEQKENVYSNENRSSQQGISKPLHVCFFALNKSESFIICIHITVFYQLNITFACFYFAQS